MAYTAGTSVQAAKKALEEYEKQAPAAYVSQYQPEIDTLYNQINNREKFSYNANNDTAYQNLKDVYVNQGKQAMKDTVGKVSAQTGGYGNSYAQTAGQQAYNAYLTELAGKIPELEEAAYSRYKDEEDSLYSRLSAAQALESAAYGKYQDNLNNYLTERSYLSDKYNNELSFDYSKYSDEVSNDQWERQFALSKASASGGSGGSSSADTAVKATGTNISGRRTDISGADYDEILAAAKMSETMLDKKLTTIQAKYGLTNSECQAIKDAYIGYVPEKQNQANQKAYNNKFNSYEGEYQGAAAGATGYYTSGNMF